MCIHFPQAYMQATIHMQCVILNLHMYLLQKDIGAFWQSCEMEHTEHCTWDRLGLNNETNSNQLSFEEHVYPHAV